MSFVYDLKPHIKPSRELTAYAIKSHSKAAVFVNTKQCPYWDKQLNAYQNYFAEFYDRVCVIPMGETVASKFPELKRFMVIGDSVYLRFTRGVGYDYNDPNKTEVAPWALAESKIYRKGEAIPMPRTDVIYSQLSIEDLNMISPPSEYASYPAAFMGENFDE